MLFTFGIEFAIHLLLHGQLVHIAWLLSGTDFVNQASEVFRVYSLIGILVVCEFEDIIVVHILYILAQ